MSHTDKIIDKLLDHQHLDKDEVSRALQIMASGGATPAQISCILTCMRLNNYSAQEFCGAIEFLRHKLPTIPFNKNIFYIYSDHSHAEESIVTALILASINISTLVYFKRVTDINIPDSLGINLQIKIDTLANCLNTLNIGIAFFPKQTPLRNILDVTSELNFVNILDQIEPMFSPLNTNFHFARMNYKCDLTTAAEAIKMCGISNIYLEHKNDVAIIHNDKINTLSTPHHEDKYKLTVYESAARIKAILLAEDTANLHSILHHAAQMILLAGSASNIDSAIDIAKNALKNHRLIHKLEELVSLSNS